MPRDWLLRLPPKGPVLCQVESKTLTQSINQSTIIPMVKRTDHMCIQTQCSYRNAYAGNKVMYEQIQITKTSNWITFNFLPKNVQMLLLNYSSTLCLKKVLHYLGKLKIQIFCRYSVYMEEMQTICILSEPILVPLRVQLCMLSVFMC